MKKYIVFLLAILLIPMNAYSNDKLRIILKDNNFEGKAKIEISVCNEISDEIIIYARIGVEKKINEKWTFNKTAGCPCDAMCDPYLKYLEKGQCIDHTIDVNTIDCGFDKKGEYRFVITGTVGLTEDPKDLNFIKLGTSESFFVK